MTDEAVLQALAAIGVVAAEVLDQRGATTEAHDLLEELLDAFDLPCARTELPAPDDAAAREQKRKFALRHLPPDAGTPERFARERLKMLPTLRELVADIRELRSSRRLPTGVELAQRRMAIARRWNAALEDEGATELPPLCEVCGLPVLARRPERDGTLSTVCGDVCRDARKKRQRREP